MDAPASSDLQRRICDGWKSPSKNIGENEKCLPLLPYQTPLDSVTIEHLVGKRNKKSLYSYKRKLCLQEFLLFQDRGLADLSLSLQIRFCFLCLCVSHDALCTSESLHRHSTNHSPEGIISWILCEVVSR